VLIEKSLLDSCKTNNSSGGGAIYFYNYGYFLLYQICGYDCATCGNFWGQFCGIESNSNNVYNSSLFSSSIINSFNSNSEETIRIVHGRDNIIKTNISNNILNIHCTCCRDFTLSI
jgi:hypothetical protein